MVSINIYKYLEVTISIYKYICILEVVTWRSMYIYIYIYVFFFLIRGPRTWGDPLVVLHRRQSCVHRLQSSVGA